MRLKIHNINKVKDADISLNGLTVIAGANSSGKSTIGKLLFSMVKAMSNAEFRRSQTHEKKLQNRVDNLYSRASNCFSRLELPRLDELMPLPSVKMTEKLIGLPDEAKEYYLNELQSLFNSVDITPRLRTLFDQDIDNIRIAMGDSVAADVASEVRVFIESEFMGNIMSSGCTESSATLEMDTPQERLELSFMSDSIQRVNAAYRTPLSDATYVESPLYLHILDTLLLANTYREGKKQRNIFTLGGMVPIHIKDLATKINAMQYSSKGNSLGIDINSIIGGNFEIEKDSQRLIFRPNDESATLSPINIASGIKTFGLVQILLQTNIIGPDRPLIWDEPENHLHPEWQIDFAKILVLLSKSGIPIVVSTHSPYFVQGIRYFSAKYELENYTNYYLAEVQNDNLSIIRDVSNDLNQIFRKLAAPLSEIMNVDMVRKK